MSKSIDLTHAAPAPPPRLPPGGVEGHVLPQLSPDELHDLIEHATELPWIDMVDTAFDGEIRNPDWHLILTDPEGDDRPADRALAVAAVNALPGHLNKLARQAELLDSTIALSERRRDDILEAIRLLEFGDPAGALEKLKGPGKVLTQPALFPGLSG